MLCAHASLHVIYSHPFSTLDSVICNNFLKSINWFCVAFFKKLYCCLVFFLVPQYCISLAKSKRLGSRAKPNQAHRVLVGSAWNNNKKGFWAGFSFWAICWRFLWGNLYVSISFGDYLYYQYAVMRLRACFRGMQAQHVAAVAVLCTLTLGVLLLHMQKEISRLDRARLQLGEFTFGYWYEEERQSSNELVNRTAVLRFKNIIVNFKFN